MEKKKSKSVKELRDELMSENKASGLIGALFDDGTFAELGAFVRRSTTPADSGDKASDFEGVRTGYGSVGGRLVFAFVQDSDRMKGAFGAAQAKKICSLYDMAYKAGAPVVGVFNSFGAKIEEGIAAMAAYASVMKKSAEVSGFIPQIAVVNGVCAGSAAAFAAMFDFVVAGENADIYVSSPFVTGEKNTAECAAKCGICDILCQDEEIPAKIRELISFLPQNSSYDAIVENDDDLNRLTPELSGILGKSDARAVIKAIADNGKYLELASGYAPEMICAFASLGEFSCGIVANDPAVKNGAITPMAAEKAAGFVNLCSSYGLSVITLVDSVGAEASLDNEKSAYASSLASLVYSYADAQTPVITAIVGKAYGIAGTVFGAKSAGADVVLATENAVISAMAPEAAVAFLDGGEVPEGCDPVAYKNEKIKSWTEANASPINAARLGEVDDIVLAEELRQRILYAVEMLSAD